VALRIVARWRQEIRLVDGGRHNLIYYTKHLKSIPENPGVYVFARIHGRKVSPIYIGQADNLRKRIEQQFKSVPLMMGIKKLPRGKRVLIYCEPVFKRKQDRKKVINIIEKSLIDHVLSQGSELLNKQGTKRPAHTIQFSGNRISERIIPRKVLIKTALTKRSSRRKKRR